MINENDIPDIEFNEDLNNDLLSKYLTFKIDGQFYGVSIKSVIEIVQIQCATKLPEMPDYFKGIINLRGQMIPLLDVNMRFGKPEKAITDRTCVIIVDVGARQTGLIVDIVDEVLDVDDEKISAPPMVVHQNNGIRNSDLITGIARIGKKVILLIDVEKLTGNVEFNV